VATVMRGDSFSGHSTPAFSIGIRCGSVCICSRMSNSTSPSASEATMAWRR
jgi:formylmethanofuran dehydrogenase subunit E